MADIVRNKSNLIIIGAGGFGRELETWLSIEKVLNEYTLKGYLDDNYNALANYPTDYKIIGKPLSYKFQKNDIAVMGIVDPGIKETIISKLKSSVKFFTFISKYSLIGKFNKIGSGSIICPGVSITTNIDISDYVTVNSGTQIGHDVKIEKFSSLMANIDIGGKCFIDSNVFIGTGVTIIPSIIIGKYAKVGAGSTVIRNVKDNTSVFGNPAIKINK
jgi:sugar O-acyltransferase (sialic acid O-acetyltransferase NeuD family)